MKHEPRWNPAMVVDADGNVKTTVLHVGGDDVVIDAAALAERLAKQRADDEAHDARRDAMASKMRNF